MRPLNRNRATTTGAGSYVVPPGQWVAEPRRAPSRAAQLHARPRPASAPATKAWAPGADVLPEWARSGAALPAGNNAYSRRNRSRSRSGRIVREGSYGAAVTDRAAELMEAHDRIRNRHLHPDARGSICECEMNGFSASRGARCCRADRCVQRFSVRVNGYVGERQQAEGPPSGSRSASLRQFQRGARARERARARTVRRSTSRYRAAVPAARRARTNRHRRGWPCTRFLP